MQLVEVLSAELIQPPLLARLRKNVNTFSSLARRGGAGNRTRVLQN